MPEITNSNNTNIQQHYSENTKATRPQHVVAQPPSSIPRGTHVFNDIDANIRMKKINQDIYQGKKEREKNSGKKFLICFGTAILAILGLRFLHGRFRKS